MTDIEETPVPETETPKKKSFFKRLSRKKKSAKAAEEPPKEVEDPPKPEEDATDDEPPKEETPVEEETPEEDTTEAAAEPVEEETPKKKKSFFGRLRKKKTAKETPAEEEAAEEEAEETETPEEEKVEETPKEEEPTPEEPEPVTSDEPKEEEEMKDAVKSADAAPTQTSIMTFADSCSRPEGSSKGTAAAEGTRAYLLGGNWKCNGSLESLEKIIADFNGAGPIPANAEVVIGVPAIHIPIALMTLRKDIEIAAQNSSLTGCGAYTGETSACQLKDMGVTWVIIGHSERREGFGMAGETSELVAQKTKKALDYGLKVMICIGEKKEEREAGTTMDVCAEQLKPCADILSKEDWANVSIAYEPVWAIGTGLTATPEMAQETHANIRQWVSDNVGADVASAVRIQYGGSMKGANASGLLAQTDIDGGLIGGASLKMDFFDCINAVPAP